MVQFLAGLMILLIGLAIGFFAGVIVSSKEEGE